MRDKEPKNESPQKPNLELNAQQEKAVKATEGPLLIIAGAGAGKTRTIAYRILRLVEQGVRPENILAITFTNKAAREMSDRVKGLLEKKGSRAAHAGSPFVSTFHALGVHILRQSGGSIGVPRFFGILDRDESVSLIKLALKELGFDPKQENPQAILAAISRAKGNLQAIEDYARENARTGGHFAHTLRSVAARYEELKTKQRALDFDDLLSKTVELFKKHSSVLEHFQDRWRYIHIDEYQDTNAAQYELSRLLAGKHKNICVVGDSDQSIYAFRGADYENISLFEKDFPNAVVVLLEENYRSTQTILAAANDVIKKNINRKEKKLYTKNAAGEKISVFAALDEGGEARFVALRVRELLMADVAPGDIAVLYRANFQSRALEESMIEQGIPYQVLGVRFFARREVKDALAFIKAAVNPDDTESIRRIINVPPRGIGAVTIRKALGGEESTLPERTKLKLVEFRALLQELRSAATEKPPSEFVRFVLKRTGLETHVQKEEEGGSERIENLRELVSYASRYDTGATREEGLSSFLADAALYSDADSLDAAQPAVRLMTVHAAKGLEFRHVFVTGLEQDLFPHARAGETESDREEERRLFYVAVTRARERLYLCHASMRTIFGLRQLNTPSEFLFDLDPALIETSSSSPSEDTEIKTFYLT